MKRVVENLHGAPGVLSAGATDGVPLSGGNGAAHVQVEGKPSAERGANRPLVALFSASPEYLETMGIRLLRGRYLTPQDAASGALVAVINHAGAANFWPAEDVLGKRISFNKDAKGNPIQQRIIGHCRRRLASTASINPLSRPCMSPSSTPPTPRRRLLCARTATQPLPPPASAAPWQPLTKISPSSWSPP